MATVEGANILKVLQDYNADVARARAVPCYCSGRCKGLGYCPNNPPWINGWPVRKPRVRVKAGREVIA